MGNSGKGSVLFAESVLRWSRKFRLLLVFLSIAILLVSISSTLHANAGGLSANWPGQPDYFKLHYFRKDSLQSHLDDLVFWQASLNRSKIGRLVEVEKARQEALAKQRHSEVKAVAFARKPMDETEIESLTEKYGRQYGVSTELLQSIAFCESGYNEGAINGPYAGLYQFLASTWSATRSEMGLDPSAEGRFISEEAVKTAAYKISQEGVWAWPVCGRRALAVDGD